MADVTQRTVTAACMRQHTVFQTTWMKHEAGTEIYNSCNFSCSTSFILNNLI
jgi:hypothetical protein